MLLYCVCFCGVVQAVNVASTVVAIILVDRLGRRFLFIQGGVQMILCEVRGGLDADAAAACACLPLCTCVARQNVYLLRRVLMWATTLLVVGSACLLAGIVGG